MTQQISRFLLNPSTAFRASLILLITLLTACQPAPAAVDPAIAVTQMFETALAQISQPTATAVIAETPVPTSTVTAPRTPPALPATYVSSALNPLDTPHTYVKDSCQYLKDKWNPNNSAPGTVVINIMIHGIVKDQADVGTNGITVDKFNKMMKSLHELGFTAINTSQLVDFMEHNAKIPARSVVLIQDDRRTADNFNTHFRDYYNQWGWPVINGWISAFGGQDNVLAENVALEKEGWVDHEAHGVIHNINITPNSTDEFIHNELQGSIDNFQKYFGKTPIAYIWPGGGFTPRGVQVAREVGYRLGFTVNSRGPIMFNWVPLADAPDPGHPDAIPEGPSNDPLMTLPRVWDVDVLDHLDTIRTIGNEAAAYAEQNKAIELEYYDIVCSPTLGPIPPAQ